MVKEKGKMTGYDKFPEDFCFERLKMLEPEPDLAAMRAVRGRAVSHVKHAISRGEKRAHVGVNELNCPDRKRIAKELTERFPGRVLRVSHDADGDSEVVLSTPEEDPPVTEYIIDLAPVPVFRPRASV